ncbi:flavin reductase family protein [Spirillospora sp. NBC_00431]
MSSDDHVKIRWRSDGDPLPGGPADLEAEDVRRGVDPDTFRRAMAHLAAPLIVLTCYDSAGRAWGLTVNAVTSLSLTPPMVLVCLDRRGRSHDIVIGAEALCLHVLGPGEQDLAFRFAAREERFREVRVVHGRVPELTDVSVRILCTPCRRLDGGDHTILLALVEEVIAADGSGGGLVWHHRSPARAVPVEPVVSEPRAGDV